MNDPDSPSNDADNLEDPTQMELSAYLLGELDEARRQALELRLSRDISLRQQLEALKVSITLIEEAVGGACEQAAPLRLSPMRRQAALKLPRRNKEASVGPNESPRVTFRGLTWVLPMGLAAALVLGIGWLHYMRIGGGSLLDSDSAWTLSSGRPAASEGSMALLDQPEEVGPEPADLVGQAASLLDQPAARYKTTKPVANGRANLADERAIFSEELAKDGLAPSQPISQVEVDRQAFAPTANLIQGMDDSLANSGGITGQSAGGTAALRDPRVERFGLLPSQNEPLASASSNQAQSLEPASRGLALARPLPSAGMGGEGALVAEQLTARSSSEADLYFFQKPSREAAAQLDDSTPLAIAGGQSKERSFPVAETAPSVGAGMSPEKRHSDKLALTQNQAQVQSGLMPEPQRVLLDSEVNRAARPSPASAPVQGVDTNPQAGQGGASAMGFAGRHLARGESLERFDQRTLGETGSQDFSGSTERESLVNTLANGPIAAVGQLSTGKAIESRAARQIVQEVEEIEVASLALGDVPQLGLALGGAPPNMAGVAGSNITGDMDFDAGSDALSRQAPGEPVLRESLKRSETAKLAEAPPADPKANATFGRRAGGRSTSRQDPDVRALDSEDEVHAKLKREVRVATSPTRALLAEQETLFESKASTLQASQRVGTHDEDSKVGPNRKQSVAQAEPGNHDMAISDSQAVSGGQAARQDGLDRKASAVTGSPQAADWVTHQPEKVASQEPISTFSLNVSDVSFQLARASLDEGRLPEPGQMRAEQFLNAFDYQDAMLGSGEPMAFYWERAPHPFAHRRDVLRLALRASSVGRQANRPMHLVLLLDHSGSMERVDRRAIIRDALRELCLALTPQDRLSVVGFASQPRLWVEAASGADPANLLARIENLRPEGGTDLESAMKLAYELAHRHFFDHGLNRVILLTDGAANLGEVIPERLSQRVEAERIKGIALDCFGVGWDGLNDALLERLSRHGDGRYGLLNDVHTAGRDFATGLAGALQVAASNVKVQVEWNPRRVARWRQVGYDAHQLSADQFRDASVDAGELAAAESGQALYVMEIDEQGEGPIATVRVRYILPQSGESQEKHWVVPHRPPALGTIDTPVSMRLAVTASTFAEWLNGNPHAANLSLAELQAWYRPVPAAFGEATRPRDLERMLEQARSISGL